MLIVNRVEGLAKAWHESSRAPTLVMSGCYFYISIYSLVPIFRDMGVYILCLITQIV